MPTDAEMREKTLSSRTVYQGRALRIDVMDVELPDGRRSVREVVRHRGAVVVLVERPDGAFVLVRQYRRAVDEVLLEMVAGGLEPDETPEDAARRETKEESGYTVRSLRPLGVITPCPGYSEERQYLFHAQVAMDSGTARPDDDENVAAVVMSRGEIEAAIGSGVLKDAKSLAIWHLANRSA